MVAARRYARIRRLASSGRLGRCAACGAGFGLFDRPWLTKIVRPVSESFADALRYDRLETMRYYTLSTCRRDECVTWAREQARSIRVAT